MPQHESKTTDPNDLPGWVVELSNYEGETIGHKVAHRLETLRRFRNQVLEEAAIFAQDDGDTQLANTIRKAKWEAVA